MEKLLYLFPVPGVIIPCVLLGLASFIMQASESVIAVCFNSSLLKYGGDIAVGAMTICTSIMQFAMLPLQGIGQGAQPISSYNYGANFAYALSRRFVVWYAQKCAFEYGEKGIRVCSLSPGLIAADMGKLEEKEGGFMLKYAAERRMGTPDELGYAIAVVADERNGYLAGVDVLVDGGSTNGKAFRK